MSGCYAITSQPKDRAFTLLEMLIVVGIFAIVSISVVVGFQSTDEHASNQLAITEMANLKKALLQFRKDTGHFPTQGPFALTSDGGQVPTPSEGVDWYKSPANMQSLFANPLAATSHPFATWNPDTQRGWHGSYLSQWGDKTQSIGDDLESNGNGDPLAGNQITGVPVITDPFNHKPYLLFDLDNENARIVSLGPNGIYESTSTENLGDDLVVFLLK